MAPLDIDTAEDYLRARRWVGPREEVYVHVLSAGPSCVVFYVRRPGAGGRDFVLKQARSSDAAAGERTRREIGLLRLYDPLLAGVARDDPFPIRTPRVLCEDLGHYLFAMTPAPPDHRLWRRRLRGGRADRETASACGRLLARIHGATWRDARVKRQWGQGGGWAPAEIEQDLDRVRRAHGDLEDAIKRVIQEVRTRRLALIHGAFEPDHLLVGEAEGTLIGCSGGGVGDPSLDLGFFASRLVLAAWEAPAKSLGCLDLLDAFSAAYEETLSSRAGEGEAAGIAARSIRILAACALARVEAPRQAAAGDERKQRLVCWCREVLRDPPANWEACRRSARAAIEAR